MTLDPAAARPRPDLAFLTVRSARARAATPMSAPAPAPTRAVTSSLDLDESQAPTPRSVPSSSLDLDDRGAGAPTSPASQPPAAAKASTPAAARPLGPRLPANGRLVLTPAAPVVALTRVASGIGALTVEAVISAEVGDVRLGCAYALASGSTSFLNPDSGKRTAPPEAHLPMLVGSRGQFARIAVDLRRVRELERALFVVHVASRTPLSWGGTLVITTHAGARIDVPLDPASPGVALAAVSLYQVRGEIVLRAELDAAASVREACAAFGYDAITWLDDSTPIL
jgi:hypothetical protein